MAMPAHKREAIKAQIASAAQCERCGEDFGPDFSPNVEAFEMAAEVVCDECADEIFEANSQFGAGA